MTEQEMRLKRCCFTGHRPEKLTQTEAEIITWLEYEIRKTIDDWNGIIYVESKIPQNF